MKVLLFLVFIISLSNCNLEKKEKGQEYLHSHCTIFDKKGKLYWNLPGGVLCLFFKDGRLLSSNGRSLKMHSPNMQTIWKSNKTVHHQINRYGKKIVFFSDKVKSFKGRSVRYDTVVVMDQDGKIETEMEFDHNSQIRVFLDQLEEVSDVAKKRVGGDFEYGHMNSVYPIPKTPATSSIKKIEGAEFVLNDVFNKRIFFVNKDFSKLIWSFKTNEPKGGRFRYHDVQMLETGKLLIYVNGIPGNNKNGNSSLDLLDLDKMEQKKLYSDDPPEKFASPSCGGVQLLKNGNLLFSDTTNGAWIREVDPEGNNVLNIDARQIGIKLSPIQQVKQQDLSQFLKNNKLNEI